MYGFRQGGNQKCTDFVRATKKEEEEEANKTNVCVYIYIYGFLTGNRRICVGLPKGGGAPGGAPAVNDQRASNRIFLREEGGAPGGAPGANLKPSNLAPGDCLKFA